MGQQQLILIVGGIVMVGLALVLGITAYGESSTKHNSDALLQDALRMVNDAQQWKVRPEIFGGSPNASKADHDDFRALDFFRLGYSSSTITEDGDCYANANGEFALFANSSFVGILATNVANQNMVAVIATGSLGGDVQLYEADWNPVVGGAGPDGRSISVKSHKRCQGPGQVPIHAGVN